MIQFYQAAYIWIEIISSKLYLQNRWHLLEPDKLDSVLLAMVWRLILVITVQLLLGHVLPETILYGLISFYIELQIVELLGPRGFVFHVYAFPDILYLTLKELLERALHGCILHLLIELLAEDLVEFTDVLLLINIINVPSERQK